MTINFTQPGDVAAQIYNEARRGGLTHKEATRDAWGAINHVRGQDTDERANIPVSKTSKEQDNL